MMTGGCLLEAFAPDGATGDDDEAIAQTRPEKFIVLMLRPLQVDERGYIPYGKKRSFVLTNETHHLPFIWIMT